MLESEWSAVTYRHTYHLSSRQGVLHHEGVCQYKRPIAGIIKREAFHYYKYIACRCAMYGPSPVRQVMVECGRSKLLYVVLQCSDISTPQERASDEA